MVDTLKNLIDSVKTGVHVLTANKRLSRYLLGSFESAMTSAGHHMWKTPLIMPLDSWVENIWRESWPGVGLLKPGRSYAIWKKIITKDSSIAQRRVLLARGAARAAYNAYTLMSEYRIPSLGESIYLTEEARAFKRWTTGYERELKALGFIDHRALAGRVIKLIGEAKLILPEKIILAGFDELTPKTLSLLKALTGAGVETIHWPLDTGGAAETIPDVKGRLNIRAYGDEVEEVRAAARWVRRTLRPGMRIGFIAPDLERYRTIIKREFSLELDPRSALPWEDREEVFNISLGAPLYEEPLVRSAMDIISVDLQVQEIERMSPILLSAFLAADEKELMALAGLDAEIRAKNTPCISLLGLKKWIARTPSGPLSGFAKRLDIWLNTLKESKVRRTPGWWAKNFTDLLNTLGWPPARFTLSSREYQALDAWNGLLGELVGLDEILGKISRVEALMQLKDLAKETLHQPESPDCPVQVLGILESGGIEFDHIWILGAQEHAFPAGPSPNPFIPLYLQKKFNLPRSSPERTLSFARTVLKRILFSAPRFEVSFPQRVDEKEVDVSPLLKGLGPMISDPEPRESSCLRDRVHSRHALEDMPPDGPIPLTGDELRGLRGGTSIIKDQSACPFRAFALYRLGARAVTSPEPGLNAMERGGIVHDALKTFWQEVRDSKRLKEISESGELARHITTAVEKALRRRSGPGRSERLLALEKERVEALVNEWLSLELKRDDFTVKAVECEREIDVGGLKIFARFDRVDRLENGGEIIIDYKTGECSKDYWLPGRPREPQMLLYDLSSGFDAVAFGSLRLKGVRFVGVEKDKGALPGLTPFSEDRWRLKMEGVENWQDLKDRWRETLMAIAGGFTDGRAEVDPNEYLKGWDHPCKFCELTTLCRRLDAGIGPDEEV